VGNVNNDILYRFRPNAARDGLTFTHSSLSDRVADAGDNFNEIIFGTGFNGVTDLKVGPDGLLYVLSLVEGKIYRISRLNSLPPFLSASFYLPNGEVGVQYDTDLGIGGGRQPYTVSAETTLPPWLNVDDAGALSGVPTRARKYLFTLRATDQAGASVKKRFQVNIRRALGIVNQGLRAGRVNRFYSGKLVAMGGKLPYVWSVIGTLPDGLALNSSTGRITGTPMVAVISDLTLEVTDPLGGTEQKTLTLTINP
jgi:glucose/arabinose dehydrogenase